MGPTTLSVLQPEPLGTRGTRPGEVRKPTTEQKLAGLRSDRRDVEDAGAWTPVAYYSGAAYASKDAALSAAVQAVAWLAEAREHARDVLLPHHFVKTKRAIFA
jgi:hypothetical protein